MSDTLGSSLATDVATEPTSAGNLRGRTILITGASSGVGRHLALMLGASGANVICCARRADLLDDVVQAISAAGGQAMAQACDVSDQASIGAAFDAATARFGVIDSIIANAGINHAGPAAKVSTESLDALLGVNLRGGFLTAQEGARRLIAEGGPSSPRRIIFIASILGLRPQAGAALYASTKAGIIMLAKGLALEWAKYDITVNAICPGFMPTDIADDWLASEAGRLTVSRWPRKRAMPLAELDSSVLFLLGAGSGSVTGNALVVDDGQSLASA